MWEAIKKYITYLILTIFPKEEIPDFTQALETHCISFMRGERPGEIYGEKNSVNGIYLRSS